MANLHDNNRHTPRLRVNMGEYWDFIVSHGGLDYDVSSVSDGCDNGLISYIDFTDPLCTDSDKWVYSKPEYSWADALSTDYTLSNIGYTGIDNGLILYRKDRIGNQEFFDMFQGSEYHIDSDDNRLKLHAVSGTTLLYDYPLHVEENQVKFNGGFYQGFFKTECDKYQVLPSSFENGETWELDFTIKRCDLEPESDKTLNDKYPENKGIFFYIGTRAENKWIYMYDPDNDPCHDLAPENYVEDSEINKEEYIINNFFNLDIEFTEDSVWDIDNYIDMNYYEPIGEIPWTGCSCTKTIYSDEPIHLDDWCCDVPKKESYHLECVRKQCGCPKVCKKVKDKANDDGEYLFGCDFFDGEYVNANDVPDPDYEYMESEIDISYFEYETKNGFKLSSANDCYFYTDNKFMLFDRTNNGYNVNNWVEGTQMMFYSKKDKFKGNLFILMNRTPTGYTINSINELRNEANKVYDSLYKDIINNAFALRVTDEGAIGYRYLTYDCDRAEEDGYEYSIKEGYSDDGIIPDCEWTNIHVRVEGYVKNMRLMFYVNGKLVYITDEMPTFNFHSLDDIYDKQEGVPYNISLGGGTQGLAETVLRNYMMNPTKVYPLEENFAGSFIGYMKSFKFYNEPQSYDCIQNGGKV